LVIATSVSGLPLIYSISAVCIVVLNAVN
jgi:hypothetical protein